MLSLFLSSLLLAPPPGGGDLVAIRVKRAETIASGPLEHALILVEDGKIVALGEDLPVERGIPVLDRPDWVVTPGLVNAHTRVAGERSPARLFEPQSRPTFDVDPRHEAWEELLELGITTVGFYPDGSGIPGQALVLRPHGETLAEMLVSDSAYLKIQLQASASSKKAVREAFAKVDEYLEKVAKEREKWEKDQEKKKKSSSKTSSKKEEEKKDDPKAEEKKEGALTPEDEKEEEKQDDKKSTDDKKGDVFVPPAPDEKVKPFLDLREKSLTAMMSIRKAADYLHLLDVLKKEKDVQFFLQFPLSDDGDLYEVATKIGEKGLTVVTVPEVTLQVNSLRERNIPAELVRAGAKLVLTPRFDTVRGHEDWRADVGRLVGQGLAREAALAAITLEAARALGQAEEIGSLEVGKRADLVFWSGDPLEPSSKVEAVMLGGEFVVGDVP
ncbi:MAG TPA: amidohydrolase family protein [Planctomycetota bacterium]